MKMEGHRKSVTHIDRRWVIRTIVIMFLDLIAIALSYSLALWVRFDFQFQDIDSLFLKDLVPYILRTGIAAVVILYIMRMYHSVWSFAGISEVMRVTVAFIILIPVIVIEHVLWPLYLPRSVYMIGYVLSYFMILFIRLSYRLCFVMKRTFVKNGEDSDKQHVMIIGAGSAGMQLIREFKNSSHLNETVVCVIDDNPYKLHRRLSGIPIVGNRYDIPAMVERYHIDRIILAIPTIKFEDRKAIINICKDLGKTIQIVPGIYQLINSEVNIRSLRKVELSDLLGREEIKVNNSEIMEAIGGKVVLVTGGGGSIGSELCRQIANGQPERLVIFDIYENNAYAIQQELIRKYPELTLSVIIGSVRDRKKLDQVFGKYHPEVIYHAAAHKHVPLMEDSPNEAIKNNVIGTWNVAQCAAEYHVEKMILISTDKAVNPTNVMGASKRICEMIVQMMSRTHPETKYVAVRFGNVLGSNGSVVPLFERQIAEGGPVTVTDKNIIRYFMTIQEAVSLVLQAGYYAKGGEIFVLDMGDPVKIDDMARTLIRLSGFVPDVDIKIEYVGLRPGEKLYEELLMEEEGLEKTAHTRIFRGQPILMDDAHFLKQLQQISKLCQNNPENIREAIAEVVPTYQPIAN